MHIEKLLRRRLEGKKDNYHIALSVEGGLMRGAITGGMIEELHAMNLDNLFDSYWGTSIGSINAAYLASGETAGKSELYAQSIDHLFRQRPHPLHGWLDLDWLFQVGFQKVQPLNFSAIKTDRLRFLATKAGWWRADEIITRYGIKEGRALPHLLQGACRAPIIAGIPLGDLRGGLWDAAVWENWPMKTPLERVATHLLVLRSSLGEDISSEINKYLLRGANYFFMTPSYDKQEKELEKLIAKGRALAIAPEHQFVAIFEKDKENIRRGIEEGRRSFRNFWDKNFQKA